MGFRFWRRVKIAPGVTLNLSKAGASVSAGPRGSKFTVGSRGKRTTLGIPGTGLFYTTTFPGGKPGGRAGAAPMPAGDAPPDRLTLGFFKRLVTPDHEQALVDGCRELALGDEKKARDHLKGAAHLADGAYLAGSLALKAGRFKEAAHHLAAAADKHNRLGTHFSRYGFFPVMSLSITEEVTVHLGPDLRGVLLGLVEAYQAQERWPEAIACLERLRRLEPEDPVVKLSLAELLLAARPGDKEVCKKVVKLAEGVSNETPVHATLMLYQARALRRLGLSDAARTALTAALRKTRDRSSELLLALRYERTLVYEELRQLKRARTELEKIYAEAPDYEDVAERLGLKEAKK